MLAEMTAGRAALFVLLLLVAIGFGWGVGTYLNYRTYGSKAERQARKQQAHQIAERAMRELKAAQQKPRWGLTIEEALHAFENRLPLRYQLFNREIMPDPLIPHMIVMRRTNTEIVSAEINHIPAERLAFAPTEQGGTEASAEAQGPEEGR